MQLHSKLTTHYDEAWNILAGERFLLKPTKHVEISSELRDFTLFSLYKNP